MPVERNTHARARPSNSIYVLPPMAIIHGGWCSDVATHPNRRCHVGTSSSISIIKKKLIIKTKKKFNNKSNTPLFGRTPFRVTLKRLTYFVGVSCRSRRSPPPPPPLPSHRHRNRPVVLTWCARVRPVGPDSTNGHRRRRRRQRETNVLRAGERSL